MYIFSGKHLPYKEISGYMIRVSIAPEYLSTCNMDTERGCFEAYDVILNGNVLRKLARFRHLLMHI